MVRSGQSRSSAQKRRVYARAVGVKIGTLARFVRWGSLWLCAWLLYRIGEDYGVSATLHPKPFKGDWNARGPHQREQKETRREEGSRRSRRRARSCASATRRIKVYGAFNEELAHRQARGRARSTSSARGFRCGPSIRIPMATAKLGPGYFEDRRPAAKRIRTRVCRDAGRDHLQPVAAADRVTTTIAFSS